MKTNNKIAIATVNAVNGAVKVAESVIRDVEVIDSHYSEAIVTDVFVIKNKKGHSLTIAADRNNQLYTVDVSRKTPNQLRLINSEGFGSINHSDKTVEGWGFDAGDYTAPVGYTSTGRYKSAV